jgi:hypothetical protein
VLDFGKVLTEGAPDQIRTSAEVQAAYFGAPIDGDDPVDGSEPGGEA